MRVPVKIAVTSTWPQLPFYKAQAAHDVHWSNPCGVYSPQIPCHSELSAFPASFYKTVE